MSGSPMHSLVAVDPASLAISLALSAGLAAARRAREQERAEKRAALAAERARRAARRRAETERRKAELAARRRAEREAHATAVREEHGRADTRRLDEVEQLIAQVRQDPGAGDALASDELRQAELRLAELRARAGEGTPLGDAIEKLRGRVVVLRPSGGDPAGRTDQQEVLTHLERRLADTDGAGYDEAGRRHCAELLGRLRSMAGPGQEVSFEALLGTVEHALARHTAAVARAAEVRRREEEAEQERAQALLEALGEAADRYAVVEQAARDAARDAVELADPDLAERLEDALSAVTEALAAQRAAAALTAVTELERLLPTAEERLDDLQVAHSRRTELAKVLKEAMTGAGLAFSGGQDQGDRLVLAFARPSGATYEATVHTDTSGQSVLTYRVAGEADMSLRPASEGAVCAPEELLDRVHQAMSEDGFRPGELTWEGKPPRRAARLLPGSDARRTR